MKVKLGDAFELQMGKTPSRNNLDYWGGEHKWVSIADLGLSGKYISSTKECISDTGVIESGIKLVPKGTVIMSFKLSIGKTAITAEDIYTNEAIMAFIDMGHYQIDTNYIYHLFRGMDWAEGTNKAVLGVTLNKATLLQKEINLPSIEKQRYIAAVLDKLDDLIALRKQQLALLDELVKARFMEMFGDLANPRCEFPKCTLEESCLDKDDIKCGPFGTQLSKDEYQNSGIAVWEIPQINSGFTLKPTHFLTAEKAVQLKAYSIKPGDIAMSRKGNVGKCGLFPENYEPGIIHSDVLRIRVDSSRVIPCFMMYQLHFSQAVQHQIEVVSSGAIMAGINVTELKRIQVSVPDYELQKTFSIFVGKIGRQRLTIQQSLSILKVLKQSLTQRYFK